jgi:ketosteroid isomerase-like protein
MALATSCHHPIVSTSDATNDRQALTALNRDYVRSVQQGDVGRFDEILAEDFVCSNPDGSYVDRAGFLAQTARPVTISDLEAHDVELRVLGDVAIVHARTTYTLPDGRQGAGRYTDVWARRDGRWLAVAAHVTRGSA